MRRLEDSEEFDNADLNAIATEASETDAPNLFVFNLSVGVAEVAGGGVRGSEVQGGANDG